MWPRCSSTRWRRRYNIALTHHPEGAFMKRVSSLVLPLVLYWRLGRGGPDPDGPQDRTVPGRPTDCDCHHRPGATAPRTAVWVFTGRWPDRGCGKVNDKTVFPLQLTHAYDKPGEFRAMAEGKKVTTHLKCLGSNPHTQRDGERAAPAPKPAPVARRRRAPHLQRARAFVPRAGRLPRRARTRRRRLWQRQAWHRAAGGQDHRPGDLTYFENAKKGHLGCKP